MFCPECKAEYPEDILKCTDCEVGLIKELPPEPEQIVEYVNLVNVETYDYRHEADLAKGLLLVYDIDAVIQSEETEKVSGTPVRLFVKKQDVREAREILHNAEEAY